tara:strand:- start:830 stop:1015 length:186 start_codon:yes stop_codon:yes gene_type:complete
LPIKLLFANPEAEKHPKALESKCGVLKSMAEDSGKNLIVFLSFFKPLLAYENVSASMILDY